MTTNALQQLRLLYLGLLLVSVLPAATAQPLFKTPSPLPNIIIIYTDDLGYGDLSCYGATRISTPHVDRLANEGVRFVNGHTTAATCTPSRYSLMTGLYPWRKQGTGVLPGDAALIVPTDRITLPSLMQKAGYVTGIVGKWHLGLGTAVAKDWNDVLKPGPNEVGFDYSFIFPATADRVPTVFVENGRVAGLDTADPIGVDYGRPVGNDPIARVHPELLKMAASPNHGHDGTIVNGIGRIGYMTGGKRARWTDEEMPLTFLARAKEFIQVHKEKPFFLYYSLTEPHVPRMPSTIFKGKSAMGYRGDALLQMDWAVGELLKELDNLGLAQNTLVLFSSDNGPVLDDGYQDDAVGKSGGHQPAGPLRGGKYSAFEGGTRVPWIIRWPAVIQPQVSGALVSQVDLLASFSTLLQVPLPEGTVTDSEDVLMALLGKSARGRSVLAKQGGSLSITRDNWKYIEPNNGPARFPLTGIESGNAGEAQLYDLSSDPGERNNVAARYPQRVKELSALLQKLKAPRAL